MDLLTLVEKTLPNLSFYHDFYPSMNQIEDENSYKVEFSLPGLEKKDIKIEVRDNYLVISGEKKKQDIKYLVKEISTGKFNRNIYLTDDINKDKIKAEMKNGILTIELYKKEEKKPKEIAIS